MLILPTPRLDLLAADVRLLNLELDDRAAFAKAVDAQVDEAWPPGEYDRDAITFFRDQLVEAPDQVGWYGWYARRRDTRCLIGSGGYFGPPQDGQVEIGYSLLEAHQRQGFATELVQALVSRASAYGVRTVIARTTEDNPASQRVLERCGFEVEGLTEEAGVLRFLRHLERRPRAGDPSVGVEVPQGAILDSGQGGFDLQR